MDETCKLQSEHTPALCPVSAWGFSEALPAGYFEQKKGTAQLYP